jgi:26S proteasome regulatory subunit T1
MKEPDTGLAAPNLWDLAMDRQHNAEEHPLQVARCTKIIPANPGAAESVCRKPRWRGPRPKGC